MPSDRYVTLSVLEGQKQDLDRLRYKNETWSEFLARLLDNSPRKRYHEAILERQQKIYELNAAIAEQVGVDADKIPALAEPEDLVEELSAEQ